MPSLPPVDPERSASGIVVDPNTLERIVPATRRADGTMRKELRIRPGFTPQEDVGLFRSRRQQAAETRGSLPAGHIPGWGGPRGAAPGASGGKKSVPGASGAGGAGGAGEGGAKSKAAKKNEKRKEKKKELSATAGGGGKDAPVRDAWDEDDEPPAPVPAAGKGKEGVVLKGEVDGAQLDTEVERLAEELEKKAKV